MTVRPPACSHSGGRTRHRSIVPGLLLGAILVTSGCQAGQIPASPSMTTGPETTSEPSQVRESSPKSTATHGASAARAITPPEITTKALQTLDELRVLFAHRSVGGSILEVGVPAVYRTAGLTPPSASDSPFIDVWLDQPDDGAQKLTQFEDIIRGTPADQLPDIALMKIGYIDVWAGVDVEGLFNEYRATMASLEQDFPQIAFLHATVSATGWLPEDSVAIETYNSLLRAEYGTSGRFFDLAAVVATCPDGVLNTSVTGDGAPYLSICPDVTTDGGHLNDLGATRAAAALIGVVLAASR